MSQRYQLLADQLATISVSADGSIDAAKVAAVLEYVVSSPIAHKAAILRAYRRHMQQRESQQEAVITVAGSTDAAFRTTVESSLKKRYPSITSIVWNQDPDILGGLTVTVGDMWYDLSLKQQLTTIEEHIAR